MSSGRWHRYALHLKIRTPGRGKVNLTSSPAGVAGRGGWDPLNPGASENRMLALDPCYPSSLWGAWAAGLGGGHGEQRSRGGTSEDLGKVSPPARQGKGHVPRQNQTQGQGEGPARATGWERVFLEAELETSPLCLYFCHMNHLHPDGPCSVSQRRTTAVRRQA